MTATADKPETTQDAAAPCAAVKACTEELDERTQRAQCALTISYIGSTIHEFAQIVKDESCQMSSTKLAHLSSALKTLAECVMNIYFIPDIAVFIGRLSNPVDYNGKTATWSVHMTTFLNGITSHLPKSGKANPFTIQQLLEIGRAITDHFFYLFLAALNASAETCKPLTSMTASALDAMTCVVLATQALEVLAGAPAIVVTKKTPGDANVPDQAEPKAVGPDADDVPKLTETTVSISLALGHAGHAILDLSGDMRKMLIHNPRSPCLDMVKPAGVLSAAVLESASLIRNMFNYDNALGCFDALVSKWKMLDQESKAWLDTVTTETEKLYAVVNSCVGSGREKCTWKNIADNVISIADTVEKYVLLVRSLFALTFGNAHTNTKLIDESLSAVVKAKDNMMQVTSLCIKLVEPPKVDAGSDVLRTVRIKERTVVAELEKTLIFHNPNTYSGGNNFPLYTGFPLEGQYALYFNDQHICDSVVDKNNRAEFVLPKGRYGPCWVRIEMKNETDEQYIYSPDSGRFCFPEYKTCCPWNGTRVIKPQHRYRLQSGLNTAVMLKHGDFPFTVTRASSRFLQHSACVDGVHTLTLNDISNKLLARIHDASQPTGASMSTTGATQDPWDSFAIIELTTPEGTRFLPKRLEMTEVYME
jgi:hypothetical protein